MDEMALIERGEQVRMEPSALWAGLDAKALRKRFVAGELTELEFEAVVFRAQYPNWNYVRFRAEDLDALARSFVGVPFLRNHSVGDISARDGIVTACRMDGPDGLEMRAAIRLTTPEGVRDFLAGRIDRFSIGWFKRGPNVCSVCGEDWQGPHCRHTPGQVYAAGGRQVLCELIQCEPVGREISAVNAPAAAGTHLLQAASQAGSQAASQAGLQSISQEEGCMQQTQSVNEVLDAADAGDGTGGAARRRADWTGSGADGAVVTGLRPLTARDLHTGLDTLQNALDWCLGWQGGPTPPPSLRNVRDIYLAVTGDVEFYGVFNPDYSQLAAATTSTLPGLARNSLNKVIRQHYDNLQTFRWFENIVNVAPHDGSTHDVDLVTVDGLANLPTVAEGAAYTEAAAGDSREVMSFGKRGVYVGITLEMFRRSEIGKLQAIPRELVKAAIRTRSAAIAGIFTQAAGVGPTMADDSNALFHAAHGNLATVAFSATEWAAARKRIFTQTVPGTASKLGLWPTFVLVPIDLYDAALEAFGYGSGDMGKPNAGGTAQVVNPYADSRPGDPRPIPVVVPEWTDATDWAYIVDPRLHPVIQMAYANAPQGGAHALPEVYEVKSETAGLMFTNDTLPIKIRDWWAYGVATWVGVGKNNVAG